MNKVYPIWEFMKSCDTLLKKNAVFCVFGPEEYFRKEVISSIIKNEDKFLKVIDGREADVNSIFQNINEKGLFAENTAKIFLIKNSSELLKKHSKKIIPYVSELEGKKVIFDSALFNHNKAKKTTENLLNNNIVMVFCPHINNLEQLIKRVINIARKNKKTIPYNTAKLLLDYTGNDITKAAKNIELLSIYTGKSDIIDDVAVKALISKNADFSIFELSNQILNKNFQKSKDVIDKLFLDNIPVYVIINQITKDLIELIHIKLLLNSNADKKTIAREVGLKFWTVDKKIFLAKKLEIDVLLRMLKELRKLDFASKAYEMPQNIAGTLIYSTLINSF